MAYYPLNPKVHRAGRVGRPLYLPSVLPQLRLRVLSLNRRDPSGKPGVGMVQLIMSRGLVSGSRTRGAADEMDGEYRTLYSSSGVCDPSIIWRTCSVRISEFGLLENSKRRTISEDEAMDAIGGQARWRSQRARYACWYKRGRSIEWRVGMWEGGVVPPVGGSGMLCYMSASHDMTVRMPPSRPVRG